MMAKPDFRYYLITDRTSCAPKPLSEVVEEACRAGIRGVQLREKDLSGRSLFDLALTIREVTARYDAMLFINGRPDIARAVDADGVHCRENGLSPGDINRYWPDLKAGASVHSLQSARKAHRQGADFLLFGPVFFTASKAQYGPPQGLEQLEELTAQINLPVFAVGGLEPDRIPSCMQAGAYGAAGISAVMASDNILATVQQINVQIQAVQKK